MNRWPSGRLGRALFALGSLGAAAFAGCGAESPSSLLSPTGGSPSGSSGGAETQAGKTGTGGSASGSAGSAGAPVTNGGSANGNGGNSAGTPSGGASGRGPAVMGGTGGMASTGGTTGGASVTSGGSAGNSASGSANAGSANRGGSGGGSGANAGGAAGAAAKGTGGAAGALSCSSGKYLLCEDFENTAVGSTPQGWTRHGDLAAVTDDAAKSGTHSLKLGPVAAAERRIYHDAALLGAAHWGRIFYKVKQPVPDAFVHSTLVSFTGDGPQHGASEFRVIDTVKQAVDTRDVGSLHQYLYNVQVTGGSEFGREGPYDQKFEDTWHCVEYHIEAATQSYNLYIDGKEEIAFKDGAGNYAKSDIPSAFKQLRVGWVNYQQASPGFTAWIDEIAFDDERIGCD